jgi:hypothetical protein
MTELAVCIGSACHIKGAHNVVQSFRHLIEEYKLDDKIEFKATFCMRMCRKSGVSVTLDGVEYNIPAETARDFFREKVLPAVK